MIGVPHGSRPLKSIIEGHESCRNVIREQFANQRGLPGLPWSVDVNHRERRKCFQNPILQCSREGFHGIDLGKPTISFLKSKSNLCFCESVVFGVGLRRRQLLTSFPSILRHYGKKLTRSTNSKIIESSGSFPLPPDRGSSRRQHEKTCRISP